MKTSKAAPEISPVMGELAAYIARARTKPLPKSVIEKTKHHVLDTIAAMVSGSRLLPGKKGLIFAKAQGGNKEVSGARTAQWRGIAACGSAGIRCGHAH